MNPMRIIVMTKHTSQVDGINQVLFTEDNVGEGNHPQSLYLSDEAYDELGSPDTITVTVEAGDQLTEEEAPE